MRRDWNTLRGEQGDQEAAAYAQALANISDAEFIESIVHAKSALDRFGGSITINAYREKLDAHGNIVGREAAGTYQTLGYLFQYDHYNKTPNAPDEPNADFNNPPELIEEPESVEPEEAPDG